MLIDLLGPFFRWQMTRWTRRRRNYLFRSIYPAALLFVMFASYRPVVYSQLQIPVSRVRSLSPAAEFAENFFHYFSLIQLSAVLVLTPALIAPVLASEKQNGNLELLLTTDASGWEMLVGPTVARMLSIFMVIATGLPVIALSTFCGGVDLGQLVLLSATTVFTAMAAAGISALYSVYSATSRLALARSYFVLVALAVIPLLCQIAVAKAGGTGRAAAIAVSVQNYARRYNPYVLYQEDVRSGWRPETWGRVRDYGWLCFGVFAGCMAVGSARARSVCKKTLAQTRKERVRGRWRVLPRLPIRPLRNDPMLWKDWYFERRSGVGVAMDIFHFVSVFATAYVMVYLTPYTNWTTEGLLNAQTLNEYLRTMLPTVSMIALLAVAVRAANAFESERKYNCLTILLLTDLGPKEVVRAKCLAACKPLVQFGVLAFPVFAVALALDAVCLPSAVLVYSTVGVYGLVMSVAGAYCSLRWKSAGVASTATMICYLGLVFGAHYLVLFWFTPLVYMMLYTLSLPMDLSAAIMPLGFPWVLISEITFRDATGWRTAPVIVQAVFALAPPAMYCFAGWFLYRRAVDHFSWYSGQSDEGDVRMLSRGEIRGLALEGESLYTEPAASLTPSELLSPS